VFLQKNCLQTVVLWSSHYSESLPNLTSQKTENPSSTDHSLTTHVHILIKTDPCCKSKNRLSNFTTFLVTSIFS